MELFQIYSNGIGTVSVAHFLPGRNVNGCTFFCQNGTETDIGFPFSVKLGPVQNGTERFGTVGNGMEWFKERSGAVFKKLMVCDSTSSHQDCRIGNQFIH